MTSLRIYSKEQVDDLLQNVISTATVTVPGAGGTVTVTGMTQNQTVFVSPTPQSLNAYEVSGCRCTAQGQDSLTFVVSTTASQAMTVNVAWV